jgi:hypothetical protein
MTKQEVIKNAYGEHWETVKDYVDENGWVYTQKVHFDSTLNMEYSEVEVTPFNSDMEYYWRPKSLQGVETNNGWIKIESEANLPKDHEINYFIPCNFLERAFIGFIDRKSNEVYFLDESFEVRKNTCVYLNSWLPSQITHYQPINKHLKPLY